MYFLLNACENPDILRLIYFGLKILDILFIVIPIGLVVMITIDIFKMIIGDEKQTKVGTKTVITRIIFAILLFFVPTIITAITNLLSEVGINTDYQTCLTNASDKNVINNYQKIQDTQEETYKNNDKLTNNELSGELYQNLAKEMIRIATNEIGTEESFNESNKYGQALGINNAPWCAIFVTWVAKNTNVNNTNLYNNIINKNNNLYSYGSTTTNILHFYKQTNLEFYKSFEYGGTYTPKPGDYIFFDFDNTWNKSMKYENVYASADHTGMVVEVKNETVYTIEGNTGAAPNKVVKKNYPLSSNKIMGYGSWYK